jgi:hypothetical protein
MPASTVADTSTRIPSSDVANDQELELEEDPEELPEPLELPLLSDLRLLPELLLLPEELLPVEDSSSSSAVLVLPFSTTAILGGARLGDDFDEFASSPSA